MSHKNFLKQNLFEQQKTLYKSIGIKKPWAGEERIKTTVEIARGYENKMYKGLLVAAGGTGSYSGESSVGSVRCWSELTFLMWPFLLFFIATSIPVPVVLGLCLAQIFLD